MTLNCDIAMDLVDIYSSGGASDETKASVEEHLKTCKSCREFYNDYKSIELCKKANKEPKHFRAEAVGVDEALISQSLSRLSKRLKARQLITTACAVTTALFGIGALLYDLISDYNKSKR